MNRFLHFLHRRKKEIGAVLALIIIAAVPWFINNPAIVGASATTRELPIYSVDRDNKCVSLTFDAAWGNEDTQDLIDIMEKYKIKATFFLVGEWVDKYPDSVKALYNAGHEIGNHSSDHAHFNKLSHDQIIENVSSCSEKVKNITGKPTKVFRCPYGEYDDHVIKAIRSIDITPIQWSVDSLDWKGISSNEICDRVLNKVQSGDIILFHNAAKHTPEALPEIIESLLSQGYTIVPVSELLLKGDYIIDNTGRQISA